MPATALHWLVLIMIVSLGQFALKLFAVWLGSLDQIPGAHKLGTSLAAIIP